MDRQGGISASDMLGDVGIAPLKVWYMNLKLDLDVNLLILDSFPRNHGWFQVTQNGHFVANRHKNFRHRLSTNNLSRAKVLFGYCQGSFAQHWLHKRPLSIRYRLYKDCPEAGVMKLRDLFSFCLL